jgi:hypothetical protein
MRALERDLNQRYATGQAMADDLEEILRETKYHTRMLPSLLIESFGSGTHSSQVVMATLTPEFLEAMTPSSVPILKHGVPLVVRSLVQKLFKRQASRWTMVGITVMTLSWLIWSALSAGRVPPPQIGPNPSHTFAEKPLPSAASPTTMKRPPISVKPMVGPPEVRSHSSIGNPLNPSSEKIKRKVSGKKNIQMKHRSKSNPIGDGLSIDPFSEATSRRRR